MCIPMEAHVLGNSTAGGRENNNPRVPTLGVGQLGMMGSCADIQSN